MFLNHYTVFYYNLFHQFTFGINPSHTIVKKNLFFPTQVTIVLSMKFSFYTYTKNCSHRHILLDRIFLAVMCLNHIQSRIFVGMDLCLMPLTKGVRHKSIQKVILLSLFGVLFVKGYQTITPPTSE